MSLSSFDLWFIHDLMSFFVVFNIELDLTIEK